MSRNDINYENNLDLALNQAKNIVVEVVQTLPTIVTEGRIISFNGKLYIGRTTGVDEPQYVRFGDNADILSLDSRVGTIEHSDAYNSGITSSLVTQIGTNQSNISGLTTRMGTAEGNISQIQGSSYATSGIDSTKVAQIGTNATNITNIQTSDYATSGINSTKVAQYDAYATNKQDTLTFDDTPTANSDNPVKSDGIKSALDTKLDDSQLKTSWQSTPLDTNIPSEKLTKDSLDTKRDLITDAQGAMLLYGASGTTGPTIQTQYRTSIDNRAWALPMRDGDKTFQIGEPLADNNPATKKYVDDADASKLDDTQLVTAWQNTPDNTHIPSEKLTKDALDTKTNKLDQVSKVYATNNNSQDIALGYGTPATADLIVQRQSNGQITVPLTPIADSDAVSKSFVNSSIGTSTANFLGTIDATTDLGLTVTEDPTTHQITSPTNSDIATALASYSWASTPTSNDYCFVSVNRPSTTDVDEYRRFKYGGTAWNYEYTLYNTSFTQAQWNAINSTIDANKVAQYDAYATNKQDTLVGTQTTGQNLKTINNTTLLGTGNIALQTPLTAGTDYQTPLTFDSAPTDGSSNPVTSDGIYDALAGKQAVLTFDSEPTASSTNPVTSDGIKSALDAKLDDSQLKTAWSSTVSDSNIPSEKLTKDSLDGKVDKVTTTGQNRAYGVSTTGEQTMLNVIESAVQGSIPWRTLNGRVLVGTPTGDSDATTKAYVDTGLSGKQATLVDSGTGQNIKTINSTTLLGSGNISVQPVIDANNKLSASYISGLSSVATSGSYNDLSNKPTIDAIPTDGSTNAVQSDGVYDALSGKQATLVSGTNIKTVNSTSLLGSGDIAIPVITVDSALSDSSENPVQNKVIKTALDGKLDDSQLKTSWGSTTSDNNIPSEKLTKDSLDEKLDITTASNTYLSSGGYNSTYSAFYYSDGAGNKKGPWITVKKINGELITSDSLLSGDALNINLAKPDLSNVSVSTDNNGKALVVSAGAIGYSSFQAPLTFDSTPTESSTNPVTSGGVKTALDGKVDKVTSSDTYARLYMVNENGAQDVVRYSGDATAYSMAYRVASGVLRVGTPVSNDDATTKLYVDTGLSGKQPTLVSGTNIKTINGNSVLGSGDLTISSGSSLYAYSVNVSPVIEKITWTNSCAVNDTIIIASEVQGQPGVYISNQTTTGCNVDGATGSGTLHLLSNVDLGTVNGLKNYIRAFVENRITNLSNDDLSGLTEIGMYAFYNSNLSSIEIPNTVTTIETYAFYNSMNLTSITIPSSVTSIGLFAFNKCINLATMTLEPTTPPVLSSTNAIPSTITTIYVPSASLSAYQSATNWASFKNKMIGV